MSRENLTTAVAFVIGLLSAGVFRWFFDTGSIWPSVAFGGLIGFAAYWFINFLLETAKARQEGPAPAAVSRTVRAELKGTALLQTGFEDPTPEDVTDFSVPIRLYIGPSEDEGAEAFDVIYCSPARLGRECAERPIFGHGYIIGERFDLESFHEMIAYQCRQCSGSSWDAVAAQLALLGRWELQEDPACRPTIH